MNHDGEIVYTRYGYYRIRAWKSSTGAVQFQELASQSRSLDIYPQTSGDLLATAGDDGVKVWNGKTGDVIQHLPDVGVENFLPNGLLAVQDGANITLWDYIVETRLGHYEPRRRAVLHTNLSHSLAANSADSKRLVTIGDRGNIFIWRTDPAMFLRGAMTIRRDAQRSVNLSGDGKTIAAVCGGDAGNSILLFDADTLRESKRFEFKNSDIVGPVRLSRDARRMLVRSSPTNAGDDKNKGDGARNHEVIDTASGKRLFSIRGPSSSTVAADLSSTANGLRAPPGATSRCGASAMERSQPAS